MSKTAIGVAAFILFGLSSHQAIATNCTCNGDVNNDGTVNISDAVCIADCKTGNCSCCVSSCDINCDGVVDAMDLGDDIVNDPSTWLCLFTGDDPSICCTAGFQDSLLSGPAIPTASTWGMTVFSMLLLIAGTCISRSRAIFGNNG